MKIFTVQDLVIECLKQMDAGNGNKVIMVRNDTKFGKFNPILNTFEDNNEVINEEINTKDPSQFVLLG